MTKKKLFIARTKTFAEYTADKLGLDRNEWFVVGLGEPLAGMRFSDYVDITDSKLTPDQLAWLSFALQKCDSYNKEVEQ